MVKTVVKEYQTLRKQLGFDYDEVNLKLVSSCRQSTQWSPSYQRPDGAIMA
jgi:hypothetical protein